MHLFISEYITGGGLAHDLLPESLKQEGLMMLNALVSDCQQIENCEITLTLDSRIDCQFDDVKVIVINPDMDYTQVIQQHALQSDKTWIIAPESGEVLANIMALMRQLGVSTVNCDEHSIRLCADKLQCDKYLSDIGVATINTLSRHELHAYYQAVVIKRRDGVGCEGMKICASGRAALDYINDSELSNDAWYVQPYIEGQHKSLSLICLNGAAKVLSVNAQIMSFKNQVKLMSCMTNVQSISPEIEVLANTIASALPGLKAYVGVDLIETENTCFVVDVNPRLTSSYVGLRQCLIDNPADIILQSCDTDTLPRTVQHSNTQAEVKIVC